jgi:hypothetical protein
MREGMQREARVGSGRRHSGPGPRRADVGLHDLHDPAGRVVVHAARDVQFDDNVDDAERPDSLNLWSGRVRHP